jgi:hypothetical protein
MIEENDFDAPTFTAWRAPPDVPPVLYSLVETIFVVAFGTFREKDTAAKICHADSYRNAQFL